MNLPKLPKLPLKSDKSDFSTPEVSTDNYIVIDVGASMVRAAVIESTTTDIKVLGYGNQAQQASTMNAGLINNLDQLTQAIDQATTKAINQAGVASDQVILGLGGQLVAGISTLARLNRPNAKDKIDKKELQLILERVAQNVILDNQQLVADQFAIAPDQVRLVNAAVTSFTLDGYQLASPLDFSGKEVEVCLFTASVADSTIVALQQILDQLNADLATLTSEAYALASLAISLASQPTSANALVIDVGSGTTSVSLIENGAVVSTQSFPIAGRSLTARLADQFAISYEQAEKLKLDYVHQAVSGSQLQTITQAVKEEVDIWLHALSLTLAQLDTTKALPDHIYLAGGGSQLPEITKALSKDKWTKALGFTRHPQTDSLSVDLLPSFTDQTKQLTSADITLAALAHLWLQRQQEDATVAQAFQKIISHLNQ